MTHAIPYVMVTVTLPTSFSCSPPPLLPPSHLPTPFLLSLLPLLQAHLFPSLLPSLPRSQAPFLFYLGSSSLSAAVIQHWGGQWFVSARRLHAATEKSQGQNSRRNSETVMESGAVEEHS